MGYRWERVQTERINGYYRKKPVVIEAFKWTGDSNRVPKWFEDGMSANNVYFDGDELRIKTLEGPMRANNGDYVIKGVKGEIYPCKPDIFALTYEEVEHGR